MMRRLTRTLSFLLAVVLVLSAMPAFAAKQAKPFSLDDYACEEIPDKFFSDPDIADGLLGSIVGDIGGKIYDKILDRAIDWAIGDFLDSIFGESDVNSQLREINRKLDEIKKMLDVIYNKLEKMDFRATIQQRDVKYKEFYREVTTRLNSLMGAKTAAARKEIVKNWASSPMMGASSGITATLQWGDLATGPLGTYTFIQCYDGYAKAYFPWERDGYDFREGMRLADMSMYVNASILTALYYNLVIAGEIPGKTKESEKANIEAFHKQLQDVLGYFGKESNLVKRNTEINYCQLVGMNGFGVYYDKYNTG